MTQPPEKQPVLQPLPQLCKETGVSGDYNSAILSYATSYDLDGMEGVKRDIAKYPLQKYQQRYPATKYKDVITEQNSWRIEALDTLVDWLSAYSRGEAEINDKGFKQLILIAESLIYGKNGRIKAFMESNTLPEFLFV